jgi:antagonist of KipI
MPRLAQLRPGDRLRLVPCDPAQARRLACGQRQRLARIGHAIADRLGSDAGGR